MAALLRTLCAFVLLRSLVGGDDKSYIAQAAALLHHWPGPAYFWPVGTSAYLAPWFWAFGSNLTVSRAAIVFLAVVNVGLIGWIAWRLFDERVAVTTMWVAALWPSGLTFAGHADTSETMAFALLISAASALWAWRGEWWRWIAPGAGLGAAVLVRSNAISVLAIAMASLVVAGLRRHRPALIGGAVTMGLVATIVVLPAVVHNSSRGEGWVSQTNGEDNLFLGNNRYTPLYRTDWMTTHAEPPGQDAYVRRIEHSTRSVQLAEVRRYVASHPLESGWRTLSRARAFWGFDYDKGVELAGSSPAAGTVLAALEAIGFVVVAAAAIVGAVASWATKRGAVSCLLGVCAAYQLPFLFIVASGLYHYPVVYFLMPLAAVGLLRVREGRWSILKPRSVRLALAVLLIVQIEYAWFTATGYR